MLKNTWPADGLTLKKVECDTHVYFIKILKLTKCKKEKVEPHYNREKKIKPEKNTSENTKVLICKLAYFP